MSKCKYCCSELLEGSRNIFCNRSCSASYNNKRKIRKVRKSHPCIVCGELILTNYFKDGKWKVDKRKYCKECKEKHRAKSKKINTQACQGCLKTFGGLGSTRLCRACYSGRHKYKVRKQAIELLGGKCERCGWCGPICAYDFHHKNPSEKEFSLSSKNTYSFEYIKDEILKCSLLCAICHRVEHSNGEFWESLLIN